MSEDTVQPSGRESVVDLLGDRARVELALPHTKLVVDADCLAWIEMDHPTKSANIIHADFVKEMGAVLDRLDVLCRGQQPLVKGVVFWSAKVSSFVVGADVTMIYPVTDRSVAEMAAKEGQALFARIEKLPVPTVAAIRGAALGGGFELALSCTRRVAAASDSAQIGLPEVQLGLLPGAGGTVRLPRLIGAQSALSLILPGKAVKPAAAKKLGAVDMVVEPPNDRYPGEHRYFNEVRKFAGKMVEGQLSKRPSHAQRHGWLAALETSAVGSVALRFLSRRQLDQTTKGRYPAPYGALESVLQSSYAAEAKYFGELAVSPTAKNLMALFLMTDDIKRTQSLRPDEFAARVRKVGVVGAGVMGSAIAQLLAHNGFRVYMRDIKDSFVAKGVQNVSSLFDELVKKKRLTATVAAEKKALVEAGTSLDGFKDCDVIIEAAVERMDLKKKILQDLEPVCKPDMIFATNTSSLSVTELAAVSRSPANVVGMHFFNPVSKMPLVEVIRGRKTDDAAALVVNSLALRLKKTPIQCRDGPGFIVNRILGIYMQEACHILAEGASMEAVDRALRDVFGMPMGPFRLMDEVGLDVAFHVAPILEAGLGSRFQSNQAFKKMLDAGLLGKKNGKGFYVYDQKTGRSIGPNPQLKSILGAAAFPDVPNAISRQDIIDRCALLMVNEAAYIVADGVALKPEDVDIGMVFGTGFPPFRGGLLAYAEQRGLAEIISRLSFFEKKTNSSRFAPAPQLLQWAGAAGGRIFPQRPSSSGPPRFSFSLAPVTPLSPMALIKKLFLSSKM